MVKFDTESKIPKRRSRIKLLLLFSFTFVSTLFLLGTFIRNFSPPVDVNIGNEEIASIENTDDVEEIYDFEEGEVDSRLKWIQYEDNNPDVNSIEETVKTVNADAVDNKKTQPVAYKKKESKSISKKHTAKAPQNTTNKSSYITVNDVTFAPTLAEPVNIDSEKNNTQKHNIINSKVYVGYYPTKEYALNALNSINSSVPGFNPFIKVMNGQYVIQVGSFTDKTKAMNLKHELIRKGFPAKLTIQ